MCLGTLPSARCLLQCPSQGCSAVPGGSVPRGAPQLHPGPVPSQGATSALGPGLFVTQAAQLVKRLKWGTVL